LGNNEENREEADIIRITEIGIAKCKILSTYIRPQHQLIPQFKYPNLLRTLKIYKGFLYQSDFRTLMAGVTNLEALTLSSRTYLNSFDVSHVQPLELPNLRRLTLGKSRQENSVPLSAEYMSITGFCIAKIIQIFLASSIPRLEKFKLCASTAYIRDVDVLTKHLLSFIVQQAQSLRDLNVSFLHVGEYHRLGRVVNEGRTVIQSEIEATLDQVEELHLNTFTVDIIPWKVTTEWARFIDTFEKVANKVTCLNRRFTVYPFYPETSYYGDFIQNNQATLTTLVLTVSHFNCALLTQCVNLLSLVLIGNKKTVEEYKTENFRGVPAKPGMDHLALLPNSLERILISYLFVTSTEIATINFENFPKLKCLFVFEIGEKEDFGMTLKDFSTLMGTISGDKEKVFWLEVDRGINRRSVLEPADPTLSQAHPLPLKASSHGSQMLVNLAFQGGLRGRRESATAAPLIQNAFEFKQNWD